jgi:hypothetical protein
VIFNKAKKVIAAALAVAMIASVSTVFAVNAEEKILLGDVNGDGKINVMDVTAIQKITAGLKDAPDNYIEKGDVNLDEVVNIKDATIISKYVAKLVTELPVTTPIEDDTTAPEETTIATEPGSDETQPVTKVTEPATKVTEPATTVTEPTTETTTQPETDEWDPHIYQP